MSSFQLRWFHRSRASRRAYLTKVATLPRIGPHLERLFLILYPFAIIIDRDRSNLDLSLFRRAFLEKSRFFLEPSARNLAASSSTSPITRGMRVDCNSRPIIASRTVNEASLQANFVNTSRKEEEERFFEQRTRRELGWNAHCVKS